MSPNEDRMPYWFTQNQIDILARSIGNDIEAGKVALRSVNDEIGISQARKHTSSIRAKMPMLFQEKKLVLMLSQEECHHIHAMNISDDIKGVVADGL